MAQDARLARWRADTPGCEHVNHLNNAGAALMPRPVVDAMTAHLALEARIGGYEAADAVRGQVDETYGLFARLLGAEPRNIALVANATTGFIQALSSFDFAPGDTILTSRCDYTSNQIQYLALAKRQGVRILHADDLPEGGIDPDSVHRLLRANRVRLVSVSWIPTNSGLVQDVAAVGRVCREAGTPFLIDACQALGQIEIDVAALHCDYLSATGRKFLRGPRGTGVLYASDQALARGDHPLFVDMRGAVWSSPDAYELAPTAKRYEDWEFPYALVLGMAAAARYALTVGVGTARELAWALAARARDGLAAMPGVRVLDRGCTRCALVTFDRPGRDAERVVAALSARKINTVASLKWYNQYDFVEKQVDAAVRMSPHYYNTEGEVDAFLEAVREALAGA
ncbi:MAG: aminotransferase class V-fold PLP-dependent enzyme [Gemmatimonadales bacterium]|nr:aminotransferase class V-fold PLP-dependent enzyme [Gemmatimonadales bacterium]